MSTVRRKRFRRRMFPVVDRSLQYRLLAMMLVYGFVLMAFMMLCFLFPDVLKLDEAAQSIEVRAAVAERVLYLHARVWPAALALICLIGLHSFREFHRLIGPLFRFRWAFDQVKQGNLAFRVRLRKGDHLHREEILFNEMLESLTSRLNEIATALRHAEDEARRAQARKGRGPGDSAGWMASHVACIQGARRAAETFQLPECEDQGDPASEPMRNAGART